MRVKSGRLFFELSSMEKRAKPNVIILRGHPRDRGVQRNVGNAFRLHPHIDDLQTSILTEFVIKSARKPVV